MNAEYRQAAVNVFVYTPWNTEGGNGKIIIKSYKPISQPKLKTGNLPNHPAVTRTQRNFRYNKNMPH